MGMCLQLMAKYRHLEVVDSRIAESLEQRLSGSSTQAQIHSSPSRRAKALGIVPGWFVALSSYRLWMSGLLLFLVANSEAPLGDPPPRGQGPEGSRSRAGDSNSCPPPKALLVAARPSPAE